MTNYVIFGATSAIAESTMRALVTPHSRFFLVARSAEKLEKIAADLRVRGATYVGTAVYDFFNAENMDGLVAQASAGLGHIDQALIAFGSLIDQADAEKTPAHTAKEIALDFSTPAILSQLIANHMRDRHSGLLAVITSVAGDRGRGSNYFYGAAKGGLGIFLQGLRHKLSASGVEILDIRPGFVDTPMTRSFPKGSLWAKPETVGCSIAEAMRMRQGGRFYVPRFWALIMLMIRSLPTALIHKTKL